MLFRSLSDATLTAHLLARLQDEVARRFEDRLGGTPVGHATLCRLQRAPRQRLDQALGSRPAAAVGSLSHPAG